MATNYRIVPKRDFGTGFFLINGRQVRQGFVVTDGFCNVMPGATWFQTVADAMRALRILIEVNGDARRFWIAMREETA